MIHTGFVNRFGNFLEKAICKGFDFILPVLPLLAVIAWFGLMILLGNNGFNLFGDNY